MKKRVELYPGKDWEGQPRQREQHTRNLRALHGDRVGRKTERVACDGEDAQGRKWLEREAGRPRNLRGLACQVTDSGFYL